MEMLEKDQHIRYHYDLCEKRLNYDSLQLKNMVIEAQKIDSINQIKMVKILDHYGYPGRDMVGSKIRNEAFFIIQHFPSIELQKKYYPIVKKAVEDGQLDKLMLMFLEDRIRVREGKEQKNQTQVKNDT